MRTTKIMIFNYLCKIVKLSDMSYKSLIFLGITGIMLIAACGNNPYGPTGFVPTPEKPDQTQPEERVFAEGADISWVTQMEGDGQKFLTAGGQEMECTALMKELGFEAIRLRVWVDPAGGWCAKEDVLEKARRAQELGMRIMIDFHYSDDWADPSKQVVPAAWKDYTIEQMANAVSRHTEEVLKLLKDNGVDVEWVQTGNEVNNGMLHPLGKVQGKTCENFIRLANAGRSAVRKVYPKAKTIIHVSNGHDNALFDWFFGLMKTGGADYDIIGMSLYPCWWENNGWRDWKINTDKCLDNIKAMSSKYGKPVMICEFGMPVWEPQKAKDALEYMLEEAKDIEECLGLFWWEPQTDGVWKPSHYDSLGWGAYDMGAFKNGQATAALEPFNN